VASFASLISRIQQVGDAAAKHGRKLAITGRSMRNNVKIAQRLGYLELPPDLLIDISEVGKLPAHRVTVMATGSQGEPTAVLGRLATGRHRQLSIQEGDTVVMSAHPIPGNEEMIYRIINRLFQRGANVLYNQVAQVHVSGHASQEEMKLMINLVRPKFLIPVHGELRHLRQHAAMARNLGIPADNIAVVENGTVLELDEHSLKVRERIPGGYVYVDGAGVGDIGHSILRDREKLANGGFVVAIVNVNPSGALIGKPQFVSRGFTDLESSNGLLSGAEKTITQMAGMQWSNKDELANRLTGALNRYFYSEIGRRPVVDVVLK
jgi:ribonuclease J